MSIVTNARDLSIEIIDEYLQAARACLETHKPDGGLLGYPAMLLLLCATDAMSHGQSQRSKPYTQLDVLNDPPLSLGLTKPQLGNLLKWFRDGLCHLALMVRNVTLLPDRNGLPFEFSRSDALVGVRVPVFFESVASAWNARKPQFIPHTQGLPIANVQSPVLTSSQSPPASGSV